MRRMSIALRERGMTREQFLDWVERQDTRFEFDGFEPVAMVSGTNNHSQTSQNIYFATRTRLKGKLCRILGPDAGLATVGDAVRYPDALVTCTPFKGLDRLVPGVVVVFEVLSPTSGRNDRIDKLLEYRAMPSIRRYIILEHTSAALTVFSRLDGQTEWTAAVLTAEDTLVMPEIGVEIPIAEFYEGVDLPGAEGSGAN